MDSQDFIQPLGSEGAHFRVISKLVAVGTVSVFCCSLVMSRSLQNPLIVLLVVSTQIFEGGRVSLQTEETPCHSDMLDRSPNVSITK